MKPRARPLIALLAAFAAQAVTAQTLLEVHAAGHTLDFVDPGSGRQLASVDVAARPSRVAISPDGKLAAVLSCGDTSAAAPRPSIEIDIVDLEHPQVLRRLPLSRPTCPDSLAWPEPERIAIADGPASPMDAIDPVSGRVVGTWTNSENAVVARPDDGHPSIDVTTVAVQQFLASGGDLRQLATTPVIPRAVCHACTPDP
jgi:hypothetical protein